MTIEQQNNVLIQIENLLKIDLNKKIAEIYPEQTEIGNIQISKMTVSEFLNLTKRLLNQIASELKSENRLILPFTISTPELGQFNLDQTVNELNSQISNKQLANAENSVMKLAQYSLQNGFYDKGKYKIHPTDSLKLEKQKENLDIISANYDQLKIKYENLINELETTKSTLNDFYSQKQTELQQITNNLDSTNSNNIQIQNLLTQSSQSQTKILTLSEQAEKEKNKIDLLKTEIDKTHSELKNYSNSLISELEDSDKNFKTKFTVFTEKLNFIEGKTKYFDERNEYLNNLIGREVGASLFETFKQRKQELNSPLNFWKWSVALMSILTFVIILLIFTNFFGLFGKISTEFHWENILVNTLKSSPFFFLLYYTIAQYNKERNFQEEYAFKSASALTIKAYADIINDLEKKDDLILKAVYGLYRSPIYSKLKSTKEVNSALDMIGEVVNKGTEIFTKK
ncbi:hypothetical protein AAFH68_24270 [Flavobacterium sp. CGRL1]